MVGPQQTSFIPKRPITAVSERPVRSRSFGLVNILAFLILLAALIFYGGAWFYRRVLDDEINSPCRPVPGSTEVQKCGLIATVELERRSLDQNTILLFQRLDRKFKIARDLLEQHVDILPVFTLLEELTLPSVYYDSFNFTDGKLTLSGVAASYEDIAVQTQIFTQDKSRIQSFIFSDLNTTPEEEVVTFNLTMLLTPGSLSYLNKL